MLFRLLPSPVQVVCPEEVSACVLMKMKHAAEDRLGCRVEAAVVTVPGKIFFPNYRHMLKGYDIAMRCVAD